MIIDPQKTVVPLLGLGDSTTPRFLGTGAFCGEKPYLVTAEHVIRDWPGPLGIIIGQDGVGVLHVASILARRRETDLAILDVPSYRAPFHFPLGDEQQISLNNNVISLEYGTTRSAERAIHFNPATRVGNVTRFLDLEDMYGEAGNRVLELSFPALRGASGSPVVSPNHDFALWGVVIANISYHLLPAQIESVLNDRNEVEEEVRYMLPQAIAVNVKHVRNLISTFEQGIPNGSSSGPLTQLKGSPEAM